MPLMVCVVCSCCATSPYREVCRAMGEIGSGKTLCHDIYPARPITTVSLAINTYCMMDGHSSGAPLTGVQFSGACEQSPGAYAGSGWVMGVRTPPSAEVLSSFSLHVIMQACVFLSVLLLSIATWKCYVFKFSFTLLIMLICAKFWSIYCKTCTSEYSKWLPPVASWQLPVHWSIYTGLLSLGDRFAALVNGREFQREFHWCSPRVRPWPRCQIFMALALVL